MKKMIFQLLVVVCLTFVSYSVYGATLTVNQTFAANSTTNWALNVGSNSNVRIYWRGPTLQSGDFLGAGLVAGGSAEALYSGTGATFTLLISSSNGTANIVLTCGSSNLTRSFQIDYYPETSPLLTSSTLTVGSDASIRGTLTANYLSAGGSYISGNLAAAGTINAYSSLGVGMTTSPSTKLHVYNSTVLGSTTGNYVALTRTQGNSNTPFMANDFVVRDSTGSTWNTTSYLKGISINSSYLTPSTLRSWIKQSPYKERIDLGSSGTTFMSVGSTVGIGTTHPNGAYKLDVYGTIHARGIIVDEDGIADYVFKKNYKLLKLAEVEQFIKDNGHLPDVPSDADVKANGLNMVDMQTKLLQKIEELTLYVIDQQKKIDNLEKSLDASQK